MPTPSNYHDPLGGEVVEPSPPDDGEPTDVALLARSIEREHLRCTAAAGTAAVVDGPLPIGAVTTNVLSGDPDPFLRVANSGVANGKLAFTTTESLGLYEVTAWVGTGGSAVDSVTLVVLEPGGGTPTNFLLDERSGTGRAVCLHGLVDITAADAAIAVERDGGGDGVSTQLLRLVVKRVES